MKATILFTGGKDSTYALHLAFLQGYDIQALSSLIPLYDYSMLYHRPVLSILKLQSRSIGLPLEYLYVERSGEELRALYRLLKRVKEHYGVKAVFTGGVLSDYQRMSYLYVAEKLSISVFNPLWRFDQEKYLLELVENGIEFILLTINTMGLPKKFLGRVITIDDAYEIIRRARKYRFNPSFEGGEAETLVIYAPLFKRRLLVEGCVLEKGPYEYSYVIKNASLT